MTDDTHGTMQSVEEIEEWFLDVAASDAPPVGKMLDVVGRVGAQNRTAANSLAEMLCDVLIEQRDFDGMLALVRIGSAWRDGLSPARCREYLAKATRDRLLQAIIKSAGFDDGVPVDDCLRRVALLVDLSPGSYCYDATWGFGVVKRCDDFYGKITIDFRRKRGHQMTFAYAAETLEKVADDHLLVRVHEDREGMRGLAEEQPGEVVRLALASLGDMTVADLKDRLTDELLSDGDWRAFWDNARKALKGDPLVEIPAKRSERICLLAEARRYDDAWFARLADTKLREDILAMLRELHEAGESIEADGAHAQTVADRVRFACRGVLDDDPAMAAALLLASARLGVRGGEGTPSVEVLAETSERLRQTLRTLGARDRGEFLTGLWDVDADAAKDKLAVVLPELAVPTVDDVIAFLVERGARDDIVARLRPLVDAKQPGIFIACWLARHAAEAVDWGVGDRETIVLCAIDALEWPVGGDELKAQKLLRQTFLDNDWLTFTVGGLSEAGRVRLLTRVERSNGWDASEKRSVLARLVKLYPHLQQTLAGPGTEEPERPTRVTSWRSLRARHEQFRKLVEEEIPANSKEIGVARSYGDLRENFEYQAARDHQRLLMQRKAEMEADLAVVKGTDFRDASTDAAGMGVEVVVAGDDDAIRRFRILGEWDRDEALEIIASESAVARAMLGKQPGERVTLPAVGGGQEVRIVEVRPLPDDVRAWCEAG